MRKPLRDRLINELISDLDRGSNELESHFHKVADYLTEYTPSQQGLYSRPKTRYEWLVTIRSALSLCNFCNSWGNPINEHKDGSGEQNCVRHTAFFIASMASHADAISSMLQEGLSLTSDCIYLCNPLQMACRLGDVAAVQRLLQNNVVVPNPYTREDLNGFYMAVAYNQLGVVKLLAPKYCLVFMRSGARRAVRSGSRDVFAYFVDEHPLAVHDCFRSTAQNGWDDILQKMLEPGSYTRTTREGGRHLLRAAAKGGHLSTCRLLETFGLVQDLHHDPSPRSLISAAVNGGNLDVLKFLDLKGVSIRSHSSVSSIFFIAATKGHRILLEYCISQNFHMEHEDAPGLHFYALFAAIVHQQAGTVEVLVKLLPISLDSTIAHEDGTETTPLHIAF
jgi:ankyrin repeat protein